MSESLRDTVTNAFNEHVEGVTPEAPVEPVEGVQGVQDATIPGEGNEPPKPGRTAGRLRDEAGRLLPGPTKKEQTSAAEPGKASPATPPIAQTVQTAPAAEPIKPRPPRPSSWKKDYWDHWEKLDPSVAEYINQRESEAAKGVSTYKAEYDRLKPFADVISTNQQMFQQHGIDPAQQFTKYIEIHKGLAMGSPDQKLSMLLRIAQDYQIPMQNLFVQRDGQVHFNPQVQAYQPQQQAAPQQNVEQVVEKILNQRQIAQTIAQFESEVPTKYPHYEAVKSTMAGLLQAELATDLADAYGQAIHHPRHKEIADEIHRQEKAEADRKAAEERMRSVTRARAQAVSPKGGTPTAPSGEKPKGVRASLEAAFEEVVGSGRV